MPTATWSTLRARRTLGPHIAPGRATALPDPAESLHGYYRFPALHADRIVFCSDDDLWVVPDTGGVARRLTVSKGGVMRPAFSPDGRWIAFTGTDEGGTEIYVVPSSGGEARRLTCLGTNTLSLGWSPDGQEILCASDSGQPFAGHHRLIAVPIDGGPPRRFPWGPVRDACRQPEGPGMVLARNGGDPARWKRYRGGTVGTLWIDREGHGEFSRILGDLDGNLATPMWVGLRIYFLSDHEGVGNLYSCTPDGADLARHTDHADCYARFARSDGRRIVYSAGADIHLFDPTEGNSRRLEIEIHTPRTQRQRRFVTAAESLEEFDPHPLGHSLLLTARGRPITMGFWEGPATEFGQPWRGRHRLARWLNDGKRFVAVTDEQGEEQLEVVTPGRGTRIVRLPRDLGRILTLEVAPAPAAPKRAGRRARAAARRGRTLSDRILITNQRQEVQIVDLSRQKARLVDRSEFGRIQGACWSPDGRWIAYGFATGPRHTAVRIADAEQGTVHQITSGDFNDFEPCFDPEGRFLYFLSLRTYDPVYDLVQFGLGFPRGVRPYLVTLQASGTSPFLPAPRPLGSRRPEMALGNNPWEALAGDEAEAARTGAPDKERGAPARITIDFEGIAGRILAVPMPEGRYDALQATAGRLFVRAQPIEGSLSSSWFEPVPPAKATIELFDFHDLKHQTFVGGVTSFRIAADRKTLVYRAGRKLRAVAVAGEPGKLPSGEESGRKSGWIDLGRARLEVRPALEWRQMLAEAWRLQRDQFWVPDMSQIHWRRVYERYLPLVERVSTRGELSDLLWEMQGELGTSHCYEFGGDYRPSPNYGVGFLGADLTFDRDAQAWRVVRIPQGDGWDPRQASPLAAPGTGIAPGTLIHAVNGRGVDRERPPSAALVNQAGQEVWLTVSGPGGSPARSSDSSPGARRTVSIRALRTDRALRYRDWVETNRAWVHQRSNGRIGYLHIPNMGPQGYSEFHRYFLAEVGRPGLIVDVRSNGGGHVSSLLLDKLRRRRVGYEITRYQGVQPFPLEAPAGPMAALTDELAGSDGDIFSHCWKLYGLGPLIGKRTWGGVIGIWPRHSLVDGSLTTQPEFSFWFEDVGYGVENHGTEPDIEVENRPQDHAAGRDPQLERGLQEVLAQLAGFHPPVPDPRTRPSRALPHLPERPNP